MILVLITIHYTDLEEVRTHVYYEFTVDEVVKQSLPVFIGISVILYRECIHVVN